MKKILIPLLVIAIVGGGFFFLQNNDELQGRLRNKAPLLSVTTDSSNVTFASPQTGDENVSISPITLTCLNASKCVLTSMKFQGYLDDDGDSVFSANQTDTAYGSDLADAISNLYLSDSAGTVLSSEENVDSTNFTVLFSGLTYEIAPNSSKTLYIVGDLSDESINTSGEFWGIGFGTTSVADIIGHDPMVSRSLVIQGTSNPGPTLYVTVTEKINVNIEDEYTE